MPRFAAAVKDGFTAVECAFPYDYPAETLRGLLQEHGLRQVLFNAPAGDWKRFKAAYLENLDWAATG